VARTSLARGQLRSAPLSATASDRQGWRKCRKCRSIFRPASAVERSRSASAIVLAPTAPPY